MKIFYLFLFIFLFAIINVNASCCVFSDNEVYFDLGNWDKAGSFCTNVGADFYNENCNEITLDDYCDGWTDCNEDVPAPVVSSSTSSSSSSSTGSSKIVTCEENWQCIGWKTCQPDNTQERYCVDLNKCGTVENKPAEVQDCIYIEEEKPEEKEEIIEENSMEDITGAAVGTGNRNIGLGIGAIVLVVLVGGYYLFKKK